LAALLGIFFGFCVEHLRADVWFRQQRWLVEKDLYTQVFYSLSQSNALMREAETLMPEVVDPARLAKVSDELGEGYRNLRRATALAAFLGGHAFKVLSNARDRLRLSAPDVRPRLLEKIELDREATDLGARIGVVMSTIDNLLKRPDAGAREISHELAKLQQEYEGLYRRQMAVGSRRTSLQEKMTADLKRHFEDASRVGREVTDDLLKELESERRS